VSQGAYRRLRELPIAVESVDYERLAKVVATRAFERRTTVIRLLGAGAEGAGEDVALSHDDHDRLPAPESTAAALRRAGTLGDALDRIGEARLWDGAPSGALAQRQRRWAFESAALDLALRQSGLTLADAVGRRAQPVRFVASFRLGDPPSFERVRERLDAYPELRLKLDPTSSWNVELFEQLAATGAVDVVDLKGAYHGTMVDQEPDPVLYRRTVDSFPDALIEDPALIDATAPLIEAQRHRVAWDAPVRRVEDLAALPVPAAAVNVKPSRIGTLEDLLHLYEHCEHAGIPVYGGGQFELGAGRRQLQALAASYHPDRPNDVAPTDYHDPRPGRRLPTSPLEPSSAAGFR